MCVFGEVGVWEFNVPSRCLLWSADEALNMKPLTQLGSMSYQGSFTRGRTIFSETGHAWL